MHNMLCYNGIMKGIIKRIVLFVKPFLRFQMLISCAIPFAICDITPILLVVFGGMWKSATMVSIGTAWLIFLRTPLGMESVIVIPCGLWIHKMLFKHDKITRYRLLRLMVQTKKDVASIKWRIRAKRWKRKTGIA